MKETYHFPELPCSPASIIDQALTGERRVLLFGEAGIGKSFLTAELARTLAGHGRHCLCICADPGTPGFGIPGAIGLAEWRENGWRLLDFEALCTLDAGRFRTPLIMALRCLLHAAPTATLLIDSPGVVRGIAGSELLVGLVESAGIDTVLALTRAGNPPPLASELCFLNARVFTVRASAQAHRPAKRKRDRYRTEMWNAYLADAMERIVEFAALPVIGAPPPTDVPEAWRGRQIAFLDATGNTLALGEIKDLENGTGHLLMPPIAAPIRALLIRDARRSDDGLLSTAQPFASAALRYLPPPDVMPHPAAGQSGGPRPVARVGGAFAVLVNGVFDDPLLHLRIPQQKRSLLFDLGDSGRLPTRIAHQVSDVFITHAHIDHIGGFLWLLRARMGNFPPCRIVGPPGLARHLENLTGGVLWDRIGDTGPRFEIAELHPHSLLRFTLQAGRPACEPVSEHPVESGIVVEEPTFRVRAVTLDHGTPVLAYAFEPAQSIKIRKERLAEMALAEGPWLTELKRRIRAGEIDGVIHLPDGSKKPIRALAEALVRAVAGEKLVYATDFADTDDNRARLVGLAKNAHTFFCEASFIEADADQAARTGHLTTHACGEIAAAADVLHLVPFHFSRRYAKTPQVVYEEIADVCSRVVMPKPGAFGV